MLIRDAHTEEYEDIAALMIKAYSEYAAVLSREAWEKYASDIADIDSRSADSALLVAEEDGTLLGAVTYYPAGTGGGYHETWPREWAGFRLLAVPPESRGMGLGHALTQACIDRARSEGAVALSLGTTDMMKTARTMYERMGFTPAPDLDFYPVPEVRVYAYVMPL